jgi:glutathione S-transferase
MTLQVYQLEHSPYCIPITRELGALGTAFETRNVSNADRREIIEMTNGAIIRFRCSLTTGKSS